jgi:hypothetical protein
MRRSLPFLLLVIALAFTTTSATKMGTLKVTWKFINIVEGYDHDNRCDIYLDGELIGSSSVTPESVSNSITVDVSPGRHSLRVVNMALYEGTWEEHTVANDYSWDFVLDADHTFKKKNKLFLLFDIDEGMSYSWKKMPAAK